MSEPTAIQRAQPTGMEPVGNISSMLQQVIDKAETISPESFVGAIERLAKIQLDMFDRSDKIAFRNAMTKFKEQMPRIIRQRPIEDKEGNEKYRVVALEDVADPVMKALVALGVTYRFKSADLPDGRIRVTCILGLEGTAYEEEGSTLAAPPDGAGGKDPLKAVGSTTSYLEKYTLMSSVGMHVYGDDPEAAAQRKQEIAVETWLPKIAGADNINELNRISMEAIKAVRGNIESVSKIGRAKNDCLKKFKEVKK